MFFSLIPSNEHGPQSDPAYAHVSVILDRSGSMGSIRNDTIGGFNTFLNEQRRQQGKATLTLVQFDSQDPYEVIHRVRTVGEVPELTQATYVPRANTPLLDAVGRGINDLEKCLFDMESSERPGKVIFVVITDGQENASREFRRDQILKMIKDKEGHCGWQFVFLSADLDAMEDAVQQGFQTRFSLAFDKTGKGTRDAWGSVSERIANVRMSKVRDAAFTDEDRRKQKSERRRKA
jgi:Mg-chelatase subunit ChlD